MRPRPYVPKKQSAQSKRNETPSAPSSERASSNTLEKGSIKIEIEIVGGSSIRIGIRKVLHQIDSQLLVQISRSGWATRRKHLFSKPTSAGSLNLLQCCLAIYRKLTLVFLRSFAGRVTRRFSDLDRSLRNYVGRRRLPCFALTTISEALFSLSRHHGAFFFSLHTIVSPSSSNPPFGTLPFNPFSPSISLPPSIRFPRLSGVQPFRERDPLPALLGEALGKGSRSQGKCSSGVRMAVNGRKRKKEGGPS